MYSVNRCCGNRLFTYGNIAGSFLDRSWSKYRCGIDGRARRRYMNDRNVIMYPQFFAVNEFRRWLFELVYLPKLSSSFWIFFL